MFTPRLIKNPDDHAQALAELERLLKLDPDQDSPESDKLDLLVLLLQHYEKDHHSIPDPDPVGMLEFLMDQHGMKQKDLIPYIGSASKVSEAMSGKRQLSKEMIRRLSERFHVSANVFLGPGKRRGEAA